MATTLVSINEVATTKDALILKCTDLEHSLLTDNWDDEMEDTTYSFSRESKGEMCYIMKVATTNAKSKGIEAKSIQQLFDSLLGANITLNDAFKVKA